MFFKLDRDLQCDFDSPFWEQQDCNWRYSPTLMTSLSMASNLNTFTRVQITTPDYNYWLKPNAKTGSPS